MPVKCELQGGKWVLVDPDGKTVNDTKHDDRGSCNAQASAINAKMELGLDDKATIFQDIPDLDDYSLAEGDDPTLFEKEVIYVGNFKKGEQRFSVDAETLKHWQQTHAEMKALGVKTPMPLQHTTNPESNRGHVEEYRIREDSKGRQALFAVARFRDKEAAKLAKTADVSLYSPVEWEAAGKTWKRPIVHVALTDYPVINGLDDFSVVASLVPTEGDDNSMDTILELCQDLQLSVSDDSDPKALVLDFIKKVKEEHKTELVKRDEALKLAKDKIVELTPTTPSPVSQASLNMLSENRELKLSALVEGGKITPAVKDGLTALYSSETDLKLSLSGQNNEDTRFNSLLKLLSENEPVKLRSSSGPQVLKLSQAQLESPDHNPLLADAESRAKAASN